MKSKYWKIGTPVILLLLVVCGQIFTRSNIFRNDVHIINGHIRKVSKAGIGLYVDVDSAKVTIPTAGDFVPLEIEWLGYSDGIESEMLTQSDTLEFACACSVYVDIDINISVKTDTPDEVFRLRLMRNGIDIGSQLERRIGFKFNNMELALGMSIQMWFAPGDCIRLIATSTKNGTTFTITSLLGTVTEIRRR
jgi:hypothetical protein